MPDLLPAKRSVRAGRRKKKLLAGTLGVLALGELTAWLTLSGTQFLLVTAGVLILGAATAAGAMTGR